MRCKNSSKNSIVVTLGFEDTLWQTSDKIRQIVERAWLYIVTFCEAQRPKSRVIGNPLAKLTPKKLRQQVQSSKVKKAKRSQKGLENLAKLLIRVGQMLCLRYKASLLLPNASVKKDWK